MYVCRQPHRCPLYPCQLYHQTIMSLPPNCYHQSKRQKKWAVMISYHLINYRRNHVCEHLHHQCHHVINNFGIIIKCLLIVFKTATMVLITHWVIPSHVSSLSPLKYLHQSSLPSLSSSNRVITNQICGDSRKSGQLSQVITGLITAPCAGKQNRPRL